MLEYQTMPRNIATVISSRLATLHELQTVYGSEDLYDLLTILAIDAENQRRANAAAMQQ